MFVIVFVCACVLVLIMSKKIVLRFTLKELSGLIQDDKCRVILQRCIRKIPLQPYCLNDLRGSIHEDLDANLAKFDHELKGVLLSYKNVKIVKNVANMLHDDSRLYVTIQADFYLFRPEIGCILRGVVNKKSADHIGCLVHKAFNVSIPRPSCETDEDWKGYYAEIGQEVTFRVESLDLTGSLPYMVGCLLDLGSVPSPTSFQFSEGNVNDGLLSGKNTEKSNDLKKSLSDLENTHSASEGKKKKKHKKNARLEDLPNLSFTEDRTCKRIMETENYHEHGTFEETGMDDNALIGIKKKKKRKSAENHETLKQEEQVYFKGDEGECFNGLDYHAEQEEYEEELSEDKKHSGHSLHLPTLNISSHTGKKKKRKYSEVFQDDIDYEKPFSVSQEESYMSSKPKKKRKKVISEMPYMYEDSCGLNSTLESIEHTYDNDKLINKQFLKGAEYEDLNTSQDTSQKKKKKKEKAAEETDYSQLYDHCADTLEEVTKKKKKKKEALLKETSNVDLGNHSINISEEITQKKKKKKKRDNNDMEDMGGEILLGETDNPTYSVLHTSMSFNKHLTNSGNVSDKMETKPLLDREYPKKLSKKNKSHEMSDIATSTPVEYRSFKESKGSYKLLGKSDMAELKLSPVETKSLKKERETESDAHSLKVKSPKKESMLYLETENACVTPLSTLQRRENKYKTDYQAENSSQHKLKNDFEHIQKSKSKLTKRESGMVIPTKGAVAYTPVQKNRNFSADGSESQADMNDSNNRRKSQSGSFKTELSRLPNVLGMEKHKVKHNVNVEEEESSPNINSSGKSSKRNVHEYNQIRRNTDRACSSDSGLSSSVTFGDREFGSSDVSEKRKEVSSPYSRLNTQNPLKDQKLIKTPKTPKRKRTSSPDGNLGDHSAKKIKKDKESSMPSSSHKFNIDLPEHNDALEAERMKLLAAMVKRLDGGNEKECSVKLEFSTHKEKEHGLLSTDEKSSPSCKSKEKRKQNSKDGNLKKIDPVQDLNTSSMRTTKPGISSPLSNQSSLMEMAAKIQNNLRSEEEYSPVGSQVKLSQKTPKKKKGSDVENSKIKFSSKKEIKVKTEKESPMKSETTLLNNTVGSKSLEKETPDVIAERLLQQFIKQRSIC